MDLLLILNLAAILLSSIYYIYSQKKKGLKCIGCSSCKSCPKCKGSR